MDSRSRGPATLSLPSDVEILVIRELPAPKALVFEAWTRPDYLRAWYSCGDFPMTIAAMDLREGGHWRWSLRDTAHGIDHVYSGEYREIIRPDRLVFTERDDARADSERLVTLTFSEPRPGLTSLSMHTAYATRAHRDEHLRAGVANGAEMMLARLDALLLTSSTGATQ